MVQVAQARTLPRTNELGFYEMRFESVGGLGANLAGQVLATAMVLGQGFNGAHFSSYGSEKKGSPVKANVRLCMPDVEVRTSAPVERPHLLAVFHDCLLGVEGTLSGIYADSVVVVNSPDDVDGVRNRASLQSGRLGAVKALNIAVEEGTRINSALLGAISRASGFIDPDKVKEQIARSFAKARPEIIEANLRTFDRGYNEVNIKEYPPTDQFREEPYTRYVPVLGYANMPIGGVILNPGNTVYKDLSASRQGIYPVFHRDRCIDCGLCTQTCPDFVFVWEKVTDEKGRAVMRLKEPNYQYCKGCLKCVEICPVYALTMACERPEFKYTANPQLWGPIEGLVDRDRENDPAKWSMDEGYWWYRAG